MKSLVDGIGNLTTGGLLVKTGGRGYLGSGYIKMG